ncbi:MAG: hypothetical protein R3F11_30575 [Verrucomicrobiales bacterium]
MISLSLSRNAALAAATLLLLAAGARAAYQEKFMIGIDNNTQSEFEQENGSAAHYYYEDGDYTSVGGANWTGGQEILNNGAPGDPGFPRALTSSFTQFHIYFQLTAAEAAQFQPIRLSFDLLGLKANTTHDVEASFNGAAPFWSAQGVAANTHFEPETRAGVAGLQAGVNRLTFRRTGGALADGSAWIQFDYVRLETDIERTLIESFAADDPIQRPGKSTTLRWRLLEPVESLSISPDVGALDGSVLDGTASVTPAAAATYTLTAERDGIVRTQVVQVQVTDWDLLWVAGTGDLANAEFSPPGQADADYFFAGDFSADGGPILASDEPLIDPDPATGFPGEVSDTAPEIRIHFIVPPEQATPLGRYRFTIGLSALTGPGGVSDHSLQASLNGHVFSEVAGIAQPGIASAEIAGIAGDVRAGANVLVLRRTGGAPPPPRSSTLPSPNSCSAPRAGDFIRRRRPDPRDQNDPLDRR